VRDDVAPGVPEDLALEVADEAAPEAADDAVPELAEHDRSAGDRGAESVGPLMGGYRPSSLRLIDEAVAAAQAIEPSLFDDEATEQPGPALETYSGNGVSRTAASTQGAPDEAQYQAPLAAGASETPAALEASAVPRSADREESGLRMIGSLGRDRAEASGELAPLGMARPRRSETARELVTILPRRTTREMPVVTPEQAQALADSLPTPTPTSPVLAPRPVAAQAIEPPMPRQTPPHGRVSLAGSGVRAPSRSRRILRIVRSVDGSGPGLGPLLLIILAAVLAGTALLLRLRRHARAPERVEAVQDAAQSSAMSTMPDTPGPRPDAMGADAAVDAALPVVPPRDAALPVVPPRDAALPVVSPRDAAPRDVGARALGGGAPVRLDSGTDKFAEAKTLYDKAHDALDEGDFARSFELADASIKLRRTARTYLLRAQAEQRLDRVDDALASVDAAALLAPGFTAVWELRGRILWAARRRDEARAAFGRFLELDPNSPKAPSVRRLMNEPR
jgi:hypothetical protein